MMYFDNGPVLAGSLLLFLSVIGAKASHRFGVPVSLLFLGVGMLAGSDGPGGIFFEDFHLAKGLGTIALVITLFAGGFETQWKDVRDIRFSGTSLSTLGLLLSAILVAAFLHYAWEFTWPTGLLLGAIVSSTDAAAVFALFKGRGLRPKGHAKALLEFEAGSNDPMAFFLMMVSFGWVLGTTKASWVLIPQFALSMGIGLAVGLGLSALFVALVKRIQLDHIGLYPALTLSFVFAVFALTELLAGNGYLAVYAFGLSVGNRRFVHKRVLLEFYDGIAWLMQIVMFLVLGLLVYPGQLAEVAGKGFLLAGFLMFVARPLSVWLSLLPWRPHWREVVLISWSGLRGAVPIVFACYIPLSGIPDAGLYFHLVFFIVLVSALLQGTTIPWLAKLLGLVAHHEEGQELVLPGQGGQSHGGVLEVNLPVHAWAHGKTVVELELPKGALIVYVQRGSEVFAPNGGTQLQSGDKILLMATDRTQALQVKEMLVRHT